MQIKIHEDDNAYGKEILRKATHPTVNFPLCILCLDLIVEQPGIMHLSVEGRIMGFTCKSCAEIEILEREDIKELNK